jgi:hypothetical protein
MPGMRRTARSDATRYHPGKITALSSKSIHHEDGQMRSGQSPLAPDHNTWSPPANFVTYRGAWSPPVATSARVVHPPPSRRRLESTSNATIPRAGSGAISDPSWEESSALRVKPQESTATAGKATLKRPHSTQHRHRRRSRRPQVMTMSVRHRMRRCGCKMASLVRTI